MKWMDIAWEQEGAGVAEIGGPRANKSIIGYFHSPAVNRPDITSDETAWCMAFVLWCLGQAAIDTSVIPKDKRLFAASGVMLGTRLEGPRVGALRISKRIEGGKVVGHHIGFVTGWTATRVKLLGGNQSNKVCEAEFKRSASDIYIWPAEPATVKEVAEVSRIADAAGDVRKDAVKVGGTQGLEQAIPAPPETLPGIDTLAQHAGSFKGTVMSMQDFLLFGWGKLWWIAAAVAIYWLLRMAWNAGWIRWWRAEDHNSGKSIAATAPPATADDEDLWRADDAVQAA